MIYKLIKTYFKDVILHFYNLHNNKQINNYILPILLIINAIVLIISLINQVYIFNIIFLPSFIFLYILYAKINLETIKKFFKNPFLIIDFILFCILALFLYTFIKSSTASDNFTLIIMFATFFSSILLIYLKMKSNIKYKKIQITNIKDYIFFIFTENFLIIALLIFCSLFPIFMIFFFYIFITSLIINIIGRAYLIFYNPKFNVS